MRWLAISLLVLVVVPFSAISADEDAARYFTRRARDSLASGDLDEAEKQFKKAVSEAPGFLPAIFGLAETAVARKDTPGAVGILETLLDEAAKNPPGAEGRAVVEQAQAMMKKLDRPRYDYRRLLSKYVAALLELARRNEKSSPDLAGRCADRVFRLIPGHAEAKEILDRVGRPVTSMDSAEEAPAAAANEELLFNGKDLTGWENMTRHWTVENGILVASILDSAYIVNHSKEIKGDYTLIVEVRITKAGDPPRIGIHAGFQGSKETFELDIFDETFTLDQVKGANEEVRIDRADPYEVLSSYNMKNWNTFSMKVKGATLTVSINGRKLFTHEAPEGPGIFDGYPALAIQCCVAEFRKIAVIR